MRTGPDRGPSRQPRLHRNVWVLAVTSLLTDVSTEMILNLLPLYLTNVLRVRTVLVGVGDRGRGRDQGQDSDREQLA